MSERLFILALSGTMLSTFMIMVVVYLTGSNLLVGLSFLVFVASWIPALMKELLDEMHTPPGWGGGGE